MYILVTRVGNGQPRNFGSIQFPAGSRGLSFFEAPWPNFGADPASY